MHTQNIKMTMHTCARPLMLPRSIFLFLFVCLIASTHVDCFNRFTKLRHQLLARQQHLLPRDEVPGRVRPADLHIDGFNTDMAELQAREVIRHAQQFLPLRLRGGYTGLNSDYSKPRLSPDNPVLFLAIGVLTTPTLEGRALRDSIRKTWGQATVSTHQRQTVMYRFFAAIPPDTATSTSVSFTDLEDEAIEHGDMIILGHDESSSTVAKKTIAVMAWGSDLSGAYFVARTDDTTFVHMYRTVAWLLAHGKANTMVAGVPLGPKQRRELGNPATDLLFDKDRCHFGPFFVASRDVASHIGALREQPTYVWSRYEDVMATMRLSEVGGGGGTDDSVSDCFVEMPILSNTLASSCSKGVERSWKRVGEGDVVAIHGLSAGMMGVVQRNVEEGDDICQDVVWT
eukprot:TRINITY_DN2341_c0_g3_i1.p1 TRINITY_DN2341_c0_g3~~TRINITY_DN2341_c0_g3_i1.p1  ORF type:complete len:400 (-),score=71.11 TRINITY_DN2341_c0_g3_i1:54-1253(-)